jgi:hypothetical protein
VEFDAEPGEHLARVRHQALAAGLFDAAAAGFDDGALNPALAQGDGSGETRGTAAHDQGRGRSGSREGFQIHSGRPCLLPHITRATMVFSTLDGRKIQLDTGNWKQGWAPVG